MANRYWVGASGASISVTSSWSNVSGGSGGASVPVSTDDVYFPGAGSYTVLIPSLDALNVNSLFITNGSPTFSMSGGSMRFNGPTVQFTAGTRVTGSSAPVLFTPGTGVTQTVSGSTTSVSFPGDVTTSGLGSVVFTSSFSINTALSTAYSLILNTTTTIQSGVTLNVGNVESTTTTQAKTITCDGVISLSRWTNPSGTPIVVSRFSIGDPTNISWRGAGYVDVVADVSVVTYGGTATVPDGAPNLRMPTTATLDPAFGGQFDTVTFPGLVYTAFTTSEILYCKSLAIGGGSITNLTVFFVSDTLGGSYTFNATTNAVTVATVYIFHLAANAGTVALTGSGSITCTSFLLRGGTLNLNGKNLTCGTASIATYTAVAGYSTRGITFGANFIFLTTATAAQVNIAGDALANSTFTGTGGFSAIMSVARTFTIGTVSRNTAALPNLFITSGASTPLITDSSYIGHLSFGTATATLTNFTLFVTSLTLSAGQSYSNLTVTTIGTGTITPNGKTITTLTINNGAGTTTLASALSCGTYTHTSGTLNFATFNLACSGAAVFTSGTQSNVGTITCTTFTVNGTLTMTNGTITPSTSFINSGTFNYNGGTLSPVTTFTHTSGTVTLGKAYALTATGTYTLTAGTLDLNGFNLTTGIFSSSNSNTRSVTFGTNFIFLAHTTAATTNLSMATVTGFTYTGTGGFSTAMSTTRTVDFGSTTNAAGLVVVAGPNLFVTSGISTLSFNTNANFNQINFTGSTCSASGQFLVDTLTLATGGTYTQATPIFTRTQTLIAQFGRPLGGFGLSIPGGTLTLNGTQTYSATATLVIYAGTLDLGGFDLTIGSFNSFFTSTRIVAFGSNNIILSTTTPLATNLAVADATNFSWTGTGGFRAAADITRTFTFGTTGGSTTNAPNFTLTGSGTAILTFTSSSWFNNLSFGTTAFQVPTTTLNVNSVTLSSAGLASYINFSINMRGTGSITNNGKTISQLDVNTAGTATLTAALTSGAYVNTAGTLDFAGFNFTTGPATYNGGTLSNIATIACTTFSVSGADFTLTQGTINASTSFNVSSNRTFNYNGGTLTTPAFNHTFGTVTLGQPLTLPVTSTYTLGGGALNLNGFDITTGIFSSSGTSARSVAFGSNNIFLVHSSTGQTVLNMGTPTGFTYTGTGGFSTSITVARSVNFGGTVNTGGLALTVGPNLFVTGGGFPGLSIVNFSAFNNLDFTGSFFTSAQGTVFVDTLTLNSNGTYSNLQPIFTRTQTWTAQFSKTFFGIGVGAVGVTLTLDNTQAYIATSEFLLYAGTLNLGGFDFTIGTLAGATTHTRAIAFGSNNITLNTTTAAVINLDLSTATGFTWTGTGGFRAAANITRTFTFGTTGGTATNAPNLTFTDSGAAVQTLTTGSWFDNLDFGTTAFTLPNAGISVAGNLTLSASGTYITGSAGLRVTTVGTSVITANGKTIATLTVNCPGGTTTLNGPLTYVVAATITTTLTAGTLELNGNDHTTLVFSSNNTNVRSVAFGANKINITSTSSGVNALVMDTATNFTYTGTGQFSAEADIARIYSFGNTAGPTSTNIPNLQFTGTGAIAQTFGSASHFNTIDFGTTTFNPSTGNPRVRSLILSATGTYTSFAPIMTYPGGVIDGKDKTISTLGINVLGGTTTLSSTIFVTGTTTLTAGALDLNASNLNTGIFSSSNTNVRSINFRAMALPLTSATAAATVLSMADATNFTCEGAGGFTALMSVTRTFTFGTTGGSTANAPNLFIQAGASVPTITSGGWFNTLSFELFTGSLGTTNLNLINLIMPNSGVGTFGALTATMRSTGSITPNGKQFGAIVINHSGTTTLAGNTSLALATSYTNTAGTLDFAGFNLTCTGTANYTAGTLSNIGTFQCTAFTANGNFLLTNGNLTCTSFLCVGGFTYAATAGTFSNTGPFTHTSGNVTFSKAFSMTGTYTLTAGTLTLDGANLTVGTFISTNLNTRAIAFNANYIFLTTTTAATTNLSMAQTTGFSASGTGGFSADASITRTFQFGSTVAPTSTDVAPNLFIQNAGIAVPTITSNSYFNLLSVLPAVTFATTTVNLNSLTLSDTVVTNSMAVNCLGTGALNIGLNRTISNLTINHSGTTTVSGSAFIVSTGGVTTLTKGTLTLDTAGFSTGYFSSLSVANIRAVNFGSNFIDLTNTLSAQINLIMSTAANFSASGAGGFRAAMSISRTFQCGNISAPTAAPNLFIASGTSIPTFTTGSYFGNLDFTGSNCIPATTSLNLTGLVLWVTGTFTNLSATLIGSGTISGAGNAAMAALTINHSGTTTVSGGTLRASSITFTQGTINLGSSSLTTGTFSSSGTAVRTITGPGGPVASITVENAGTSWNVTNGTNFTGSGYFIRMASDSPKTFAGGGGSYGTLRQYGVSTGVLTVTGSNSFTDIEANQVPATIRFTAGTTQTLADFTLSGTAGNLVTMNSLTPGVQFTLTKPSGTVVVNYLNIQDSNVTGGAYWTTTTSNFISNNSGWNVVPSGVTITGQFFSFF
jgi:hypothetical protein